MISVLTIIQLILPSTILPLMQSYRKRTVQQFNEALYMKPITTTPTPNFQKQVPFSKISLTSASHTRSHYALDQTHHSKNNHHKKGWFEGSYEKLQFTIDSLISGKKAIRLNDSHYQQNGLNTLEEDLQKSLYIKGTFIQSKGKLVRADQFVDQSKSDEDNQSEEFQICDLQTRTSFNQPQEDKENIYYYEPQEIKYNQFVHFDGMSSKIQNMMKFQSQFEEYVMENNWASSIKPRFEDYVSKRERYD